MKRGPSPAQSQARRDRALARQLTGRIMWDRGQLVQVEGLPQLPALHRGLTRLAAEPAASPTPQDLGFLASQVHLVTDRGLAARARALKRWELQVAGGARRRRQASMRARFTRWAREIAGARAGLRLRREARGPPGGTGYVGTPEDVPGELALARAVGWLAGDQALARWRQFLGECARAETPVCASRAGALATFLVVAPTMPLPVGLVVTPAKLPDDRLVAMILEALEHHQRAGAAAVFGALARWGGSAPGYVLRAGGRLAAAGAGAEDLAWWWEAVSTGKLVGYELEPRLSPSLGVG